jgi:hypothetical protein
MMAETIIYIEREEITGQTIYPYLFGSLSKPERIDLFRRSKDPC